MSNQSKIKAGRNPCLDWVLLRVFSGVLGRLSLPDCLPFSKPKVNWLLHPVMVAWKSLLTQYPQHASVVNSICHFRLSLKECETRARARQKQIEGRLTRDLFAFRLSFLVKNQQNARARTFFFGKVCKCAFFFVLRHAPISTSWRRSPLPLPFEAKSQLASPPTEGTVQQCRTFWQGFSPKKNIAARLLFAP